MDYSQSGSYMAIAGLVVAGLAKIGVVTDPASIVTIVAGIVALVGVIKQYIAHKKLAVAAGVPLR